MENEAHTDEQRTIFNIPAENVEKFDAQIAKLSKKSERLIGLPIKPLYFGHNQVEMSDGLTHRVYEVMLTAEIPKLNGWTFVARLDHSNETGTVIRMVPNTVEQLPLAFRSAKATTCDHCNVARYRRDTFVVRNDETGEFKQVGSTCLKDFFGHDPYKVAKMAELLSYAYEAARGAGTLTSNGLADLRWIDVEEYCTFAAVAVRKYGWVSAASAKEDHTLTSTRESTWHEMDYGLHGKESPVTEADRELAAAALNWAASLKDTKTTLSDYEHNIGVIAEAMVMEPRSQGLAASIVGVYYNNLRKASGVGNKVEIGSFEGVIDLFKTGQSRLKWPKIRLMFDDQPIVLSVAGARSANPGTVNVTDGGPFDNNVWFGRVTPQGEWQPGRGTTTRNSSSLLAILAALAADPAKTAAEYGKRTGQCCFCNKGLDDERSVSVGYGATCAKTYGLPWGAKKLPKAQPRTRTSSPCLEASLKAIA